MAEPANNHIEKNTDPQSTMNFDALRAKGLELVQNYSGHAWTDFNLHDPGVTILEHLCFAITDLAYRANFDIRDLLADIEGNIDARKNLFYARKDILSSNPVTVNDLRKLVLDNVPDVYNVWLEKVYSKQQAAYIKGLYNVVIQLFDDHEEIDLDEDRAEEHLLAETKARQAGVIQQVKDVVMHYRNLGEDYIGFTVLKPCMIEIEADIVIDRHMNSEDILASVYMAIENTLNPPVQFYSETEMLEKGFTQEEIYSGPALRHGFIADHELDPRIKLMDPASLLRSTRYRIVDPSDILKPITAIPGILYVRDFRVKVNDAYQESPFELGEDEYATFSYVKEERDIRIFNENNEVPLRESLFFSHLHKRQDLSQRKFIKDLHETDTSFILKGEYKNAGQYFSFQHLFPPVYRLNIDEVEPPLPLWKQGDTEAIAARAKAKQLKAYLVLFEQVLANHLAQLSQIDGLLTADILDTSTTYFTQPLYGVPGIANVLEDFYMEEPEQTEVYWERFKANPDNGYMRFLQVQTESQETFHQRKNRILDHLMSRFNLNLKKYPVVFFNHLYYPEEVDDKLTRELLWKSDLLKDIVDLGRNRNQAWNYLAGTGNSNVSGFEHLMSRFLYIQDPTQRRLATVAEHYLGRFDFKERDYTVVREDKKMTSVPVEWARGSKMELLISEEEMNALLGNEGQQSETRASSQGLLFAKQPISFLKDGLEARNFRIGPDIDNTGFILIYKSPAENKWTRAGRFPDWQSANDALVFLQTTLRNFNIESEGFHLVEHILLRPALDTRYFGFNFYDEQGNILLYQNKWMDFREREETIASIMSIADTENTDYEEVARVLSYKCWINHWQKDKLVKSYHAQSLLQNHPELAGRLFDKIIRNIRNLRRKRMTLYPGIENMVNRLHDADIREDFFHFRMTVVLPAWPARFQDNGFRTFAENLFREYTPAHLKLHFKWLGIGKMKKFESLYFDWRESLTKEEKTADDIVRTDKLISFINDGIYSIM